MGEETKDIKLRPVDKIIGGVATTGVLAGLGATLWAALPILLPLLAGTMALVIGGVLVAVVLFVVSDAGTRGMLSWAYRLAVQRVGLMIVQYDPVGTLKDHIAQLRKRAEEFKAHRTTLMDRRLPRVRHEGRHTARRGLAEAPGNRRRDVTDYEYTVSKPILEVDKVSVTLGGRKILNEVSFKVMDVHRPGHKQGQIVALLGPSGVGKTQLFRRIAGLDPIDAGQILVGLDAKPAAAGRVGVVMQHYPLLQHRSVMGNLLVAGQQAGLVGEKADTKAKALLATFGLGDRVDAWPAELSGGQRQRVAIAQQLMCNAFLLMDEPFSGLDPMMKDRACKMLQDVAALHEENTILIVTHDIEAAVSICDQIIVLGRNTKTPGASVRADIDLKARGITWRPNNDELPAFAQTVRELKAMFETL